MSIEKGWEAIRRMQAVSDEEVASMTTDTKAVARYRTTLSHGLIEVEANPAGSFVLFTDHERVVGEAYARIGEAQLQRDEFWDECVQLRTALAASRAEVEGLKSVANHARNLAAWFSSGNSVPVDGVHTMKLSSHTVLDDARLLRNALAAMENNNV